MHADVRDLYRLREQTNVARAEALRLGNPALHAILTMSLLAIEERLTEFGEHHARTRPQVETLKRLVGAT